MTREHSYSAASRLDTIAQRGRANRKRAIARCIRFALHAQSLPASVEKLVNATATPCPSGLYTVTLQFMLWAYSAPVVTTRALKLPVETSAGPGQLHHSEKVKFVEK